MSEYRYRELTEAELRELEPGAEIYVRDSALDTWRGPLMFNKFCPGSSFPIHTVSNMWVYAAIREPVITMDREWQTKYGAKVRLYCVDAPGKFPVHGHVEGFTFPSSWDAEGKSICGSNNLIPAPDWCDQIPWDWFEPWVQWITWDIDGWYAFECEPRNAGSSWARVKGRHNPLRAIRMPDPPNNWREAIAQRPESK